MDLSKLLAILKRIYSRMFVRYKYTKELFSEILSLSGRMLNFVDFFRLGEVVGYVHNREISV